MRRSAAPATPRPGAAPMGGLPATTCPKSQLSRSPKAARTRGCGAAFDLSRGTGAHHGAQVFAGLALAAFSVFAALAGFAAFSVFAAAGLADFCLRLRLW